jgi:hypothetical protein
LPRHGDESFAALGRNRQQHATSYIVLSLGWCAAERLFFTKLLTKQPTFFHHSKTKIEPHSTRHQHFKVAVLPAALAALLERSPTTLDLNSWDFMKRSHGRYSQSSHE